MDQDQDSKIFDAMLATGWNVTVDHAGNITAERNQAYLRGQIQQDGHVDWQGGLRDINWVLREACILDFQQRIERHKASQSS
ncbi:MAG: hypothetical protein ACRDHE_09105 [Ktedonobacterales bacterium]